jgi:hypothetical protein
VNPKHQQFINEYLKCWNATEAYRRVYPTSSDDAARAHAARLVANGSVAEAIQQRIAENAINHEGLPTVDLSTAQNKMRLIKKIKTNKKTYTTKGDKDTAITEVDAEIELYDAQSALEKLGRHHKLFTDKTELTGKDGEDLIPLALLQPGQLDKLK